MSSILKALKKLEDEKIARRPEQLKIDADILKSDNSPRFSTSAVIITSLLLLAVGSGATYMFMKGVNVKAPEIAGLKSPSVSSVQSQIPASTASDMKTEQLPETVVVVPTSQQKPLRTETLSPPQTSGKTSPAVATAKPVVASKPIVTPKPAGDATIKEQATPSPPTVKVVPTLRVNGIAFEDGGAEGVAIVNGVQVASGGVIEGVKVEEIHKNRVKFSFNGEKFEIPLGQSNR